MNRSERTFKFTLYLVLGFMIITWSCDTKTASDTYTSVKLWYKQPAKSSVIVNSHGWKDNPEWLKALPLGNGSLGAMVFGDVNKERIQLNEASMWSGSPADNDNPDAYPAQATIRNMIFEGKYKEATELTQKTQVCRGKGTGSGGGSKAPFGCFQTLGDLWIDFGKQSVYENYYRELDLNDAVARVSYTQDGVRFKREIFVSQPDQLLVIHLTANKPGQISFTTTMNRPEKFQTAAGDDQLIMQGVLSDGKGGEGLRYMTRLTAVNKNGSVKYVNDNIFVEKADEVVLLLSASTDHILEYPDYKGKAFEKITETHLQNGKQTTFKKLLKRHVDEYQPYYKRVALNLSSEFKDTIPTDVRLQQFKDYESDLHLAELVFQFGRYLLISSSRPGTLPANLQGLWTNKIETPWNGDYHTNVNVQMNYWPAESTNLSEMHLPLFDLMRSLQKPGARTAKIHYNARGWVVHPVTNIWGFTAPGENHSWGMHPGGSGWLSTHIMEHYYYTLDKAFLKEKYPVLKASTQFYMDWLTADPQTGELLSGPSVSPENTFFAPDGSKSQICMGASHDQQVIWHLFKNFIEASEVLKIDDDFLQKVINAQQKLAKPKIGSDGRLMEWRYEFEEVEPGHRHISHLYGLHPGYQIDVKNTPDLAQAAKKSLDYRIEHGGGHTGWSAAWLINQYARLGDAENAKKSLQTVLKNSISPNLFGQHPPFQIDANFGTTAGIAEMLLQSQSGTIRLLPALPADWKNGEVMGLCARGGFVIDMKWEFGELTHVKVFSKKGGKCSLEYGGKMITLETEKEKEYIPVKNGKGFSLS